MNNFKVQFLDLFEFPDSTVTIDIKAVERFKKSDWVSHVTINESRLFAEIPTLVQDNSLFLP